MCALRIGGADADANLWPEPRRTIEPVWNAEAKDRLEWKLRDLVCSGALNSATAQHMMGEDWVGAYGPVLPFAGQRLRARCQGNDAAMTGAIILAIRLAILAPGDRRAPLYEWRTRRIGATD